MIAEATTNVAAITIVEAMTAATKVATPVRAATTDARRPATRSPFRSRMSMLHA